MIQWGMWKPSIYVITIMHSHMFLGCIHLNRDKSSVDLLIINTQTVSKLQCVVFFNLKIIKQPILKGKWQLSENKNQLSTLETEFIIFLQFEYKTICLSPRMGKIMCGLISSYRFYFRNFWDFWEDPKLWIFFRRRRILWEVFTL